VRVLDGETKGLQLKEGEKGGESEYLLITGRIAEKKKRERRNAAGEQCRTV